MSRTSAKAPLRAAVARRHRHSTAARYARERARGHGGAHPDRSRRCSPPPRRRPHATKIPDAWQAWRVTRGVVDVVGPRSDGRFVVAARGRLFLLRPANARLVPYPSSGAPYAADAKLEPYVAVAGPRQRVAAAQCGFPRDTVYAIEPAGKTRVLVVTPGRTGPPARADPRREDAQRHRLRHRGPLRRQAAWCWA